MSPSSRQIVILASLMAASATLLILSISAGGHEYVDDCGGSDETSAVSDGEVRGRSRAGSNDSDGSAATSAEVADFAEPCEEAIGEEGAHVPPDTGASAGTRFDKGSPGRTFADCVRGTSPVLIARRRAGGARAGREDRRREGAEEEAEEEVARVDGGQAVGHTRTTTAAAWFAWLWLFFWQEDPRQFRDCTGAELTKRLEESAAGPQPVVDERNALDKFAQTLEEASPILIGGKVMSRRRRHLRLASQGVYGKLRPLPEVLLDCPLVVAALALLAATAALVAAASVVARGHRGSGVPVVELGPIAPVSG